MAHGTIEFFTSSCPFSFTGGPYQQPGGPRGGKDYANELGADGDEIANATHNPRTEGLWTFLLASTVATGISIASKILSHFEGFLFSSSSSMPDSSAERIRHL